MGELMQALLVLAALIAIYAFMFRGIFGKRLGTSLFGAGSTRSSGSPAWGTAMMGGFAAGQLSTIVGLPASAAISVAVVAGVSAALGKDWNWASLPAAAVGLAATAAAIVTFVPRNPSAAVWAPLLYVVLAVALADTMRWALRWRRGGSAADKAMAYFAASEVAMFLVVPAGQPLLESLDALAPGGKIALVLLVVGVPFLLGLIDGPFLAMFSIGVALAALFLDYLSPMPMGFVASMELLAVAMVGYWVIRWIVRGFRGVGLLSD